MSACARPSNVTASAPALWGFDINDSLRSLIETGKGDPNEKAS